MDEPSTGLDPASRLDWWNCLRRLQSEHSVTVVLTTHLLDEADKADQIAIIDHGRNVAEGSPEALKEQLGAQVLTVQAEDDAQVVQWLTQHGLHAEASGGGVRAAGINVAGLVAPLCEAFGERVQMVAIGRPSLEDVFIEKTGRPFFENDQTEVD
jgi:ABC-2 type transport system ATP-binding protein